LEDCCQEKKTRDAVNRLNAKFSRGIFYEECRT